MASQVVSSTSNLEILDVISYIRGYHAYKDIWTLIPGQSLLVRRESGNLKDNNAVAVYFESSVVGHVPYNLSTSLSHFLSQEINKAFAEVAGVAVNRGAGYGMEVPCRYRLYSPKPYIGKMKQIINHLKSSGQVFFNKYPNYVYVLKKIEMNNSVVE